MIRGGCDSGGHDYICGVARLDSHMVKRCNVYALLDPGVLNLTVGTCTGADTRGGNGGGADARGGTVGACSGFLLRFTASAILFGALPTPNSFSAILNGFKLLIPSGI